jgi:MFS transporter
VQITAQLAGFVGPALAGLLIASLTGAVSLNNAAASGGASAANTRGVGFALGFDVLTFVVAAIALWLMRGGKKQTAQTETAVEQQSIRESIVEGLRAVWADSTLRTMLLIIMTINFLFTGPIGIGLPVLANSRFVEGAAALGVMLSAFGGGALVGALLGGSLPSPRQRGLVTMVLIAVAGAALAFYGFVTSLPLAGIIGVAMGMAIGYVNVLGISWLQKRTDPQLLGRVMSLVMLGSFGLGPISNAIAGLLVDVNLSLLFAGAGALLVIVALFATTNREVRLMA